MKQFLQSLLICVALVAAILIAYHGVIRCDFVGFDDPSYVTENPQVQQGLNVENVKWAFTHAYGHWIPLDTLSHMADCQMFGVKPAGHHAVNVAFHMANALLLFVLLRKITGAIWPSALVAALFALHPLNVETVAWISSRKDVLSTFFAFISAIFYIRYAARPGILRYLPVAVFFVLGLLSKPVVMTLPFMFLLLDYWPLNRFAADSLGWKRPALLALEKAPLLMLSGLFLVVEWFTQHSLPGALGDPLWYPLPIRASNAAVSYILYLEKAIWPAGLAPFYPHPGNTIPLWQPIGSLALLIAITGAAIALRRKAPYFLMGWLWYAGVLLPLSSLGVQLGSHAMADRYAYLPLIGIFICVAWGTSDLLERTRAERVAWFAGWTAICAVFAAVSIAQVGHWRNSEALWSHAIEVTHNNAQAEGGLGAVYLEQGKPDQAFQHLTEAIRIAPQLYQAQNNIGIILAMRGDFKTAEEHFAEAVKTKPDYAKALCNLAKCKLESDDDKEAKRLFVEALKYMDPNDKDRPVIEDAVNQLTQMGN